MRESRRAQERPQVIVDADYSRTPLVSVVVRNIGKGAAKEIEFDFSADMVSSLSTKEPPDAVLLNELPYFKQGIDFLAPGAEITFAWDSLITLKPLLREQGLENGITVISKYKSLSGDVYETERTINPLLMQTYQFQEHGIEEVVEELVNVVEDLAKTLDRVVNSVQGELRVSTDAERQQRRKDIAAGGKYKHMDEVKVTREAGLVLNGTVDRYLGGGQYRVYVSGQGPQIVEEQDLSRRLEDNKNRQSEE